MKKRTITVNFEFDLNDLQSWVGAPLTDKQVEWVGETLEKDIPNIISGTMKSLFESEFPYDEGDE